MGKVNFHTGNTTGPRGPSEADVELKNDLDEAKKNGGQAEKKKIMLAWMLDPSKGKVPLVLVVVGVPVLVL